MINEPPQWAGPIAGYVPAGPPLGRMAYRCQYIGDCGEFIGGYLDSTMSLGTLLPGPPILGGFLIAVTLTSHFMTLEPAQRLIMIDVFNDAGELCFRMFPAGGVQVDGMQLLSRIPKESNTVTAGDVPAASMTLLSGMFPALSKIDLHHVPVQYEAFYGHKSQPFEFKSGAQYLISGVSDRIWEVRVVCA